MTVGTTEALDMSFVLRKSSFLALLAAASLLGASLSTPTEAATQRTPKLSGLKARVAQGVRVDLAASTLTTTKLAALRPGYENLKPRARTNAE